MDEKVRRARAGTEVTFELADGLELVSIITKEYAVRLKLAEGETVDTVIKAGGVMIVTD